MVFLVGGTAAGNATELVLCVVVSLVADTMFASVDHDPMAVKSSMVATIEYCYYESADRI
jgi:hypothetical protein